MMREGTDAQCSTTSVVCWSVRSVLLLAVALLTRAAYAWCTKSTEDIASSIGQGLALLQGHQVGQLVRVLTNEGLQGQL